LGANSPAESTKLPEWFRCKSNKNNHNQALIISLKPTDWTKHHDSGAIEIIRSSILKCLLFQVNKRLGLRLILSPCCLMVLLNKPVWKFHEVPSPITYGQLQQQQTAQPDELEAAIAGTEQDRLGSAWLVDCDRAGVRYGRGGVGTSKGCDDIK